MYFSKYYQQSKDNHKLFDSNKKYQTIKSDPIFDSITIYDLTFQNLLNCHYDSEIWFITGLTQEKYKQPFYYWRFKNHEEIFNEANIEIESIEPRMTRDFQISFCSTKDLDIAYNFLKESEIINKNNKSPAFGNIQKLGDLKLFCSFIYDQEYEECSLIYKDISINLSNKINFIAIKNGGHISKGWAYTSRKDISKDNKAIWNLSDLIFNK